MRTKFTPVTFIIWMLVIAAGTYVYVARRHVRDEILVVSSASSAIAAAMYFVMGCVRGFTLIPVTYLIPLGLPFLSPTVHFALTLGGVLVSSASVYYFSERMQLAAYFETRHSEQVAVLRQPAIDLAKIVE